MQTRALQSTPRAEMVRDWGWNEQEPTRIDASGSPSAHATRKHPHVQGHLAGHVGPLLWFGLTVFFLPLRKSSIPCQGSLLSRLGRASSGNLHPESLPCCHRDTAQQGKRTKGLLLVIKPDAATTGWGNISYHYCCSSH